MNFGVVKGILWVFLLLVFSQVSMAQNKEKIERKLNRAFEKQNFQQVQKKASKYVKKYPKLDVANYYLSKLEIIEFNKNSPTDKNQWSHLRKATAYAKKLSPEYSFWCDSVKVYYAIYISKLREAEYRPNHLEKVLKTYTNQFNDTLLALPTIKGKYNSFVENEIHIPASDSLRIRLISYATALIGTPYKYAGENPKAGFDCSGFVRYVYKNVNIDLPHSSQLMSNIEGTIIPLDEAEPGDLIFFGSQHGKQWKTSHAGIIYEYFGEEPRVIHCGSRGVVIDGNNSSWDSYYKDRILFVKRLPQLD